MNIDEIADIEYLINKLKKSLDEDNIKDIKRYVKKLHDMFDAGDPIEYFSKKVKQ